MGAIRWLVLGLAGACAGCGGNVVVDRDNPPPATTTTTITTKSIPPGPAIMIYSNWGGGEFTINVDSNINDIVVGLVSANAMSVEVKGPYVGNAIAVHYAGLNRPPGTSISGVDPSIVTIETSPHATHPDTDAWPDIVCDHGAEGDGGCNTAAQVEDYFLAHHGGTIVFHDCAYDAFSGVHNTSAGGFCE